MDPNDEANYYQCYNCGSGNDHALTIHNSCPEGQVWHETYTSCVDANDGFCVGRSNGLYADPDNCQRYYICSDNGNHQSEATCDGMERFHAECLYCVHENQYNCGDGDEFCEGLSAGIYADPVNSSMYYYECNKCSETSDHMVTSHYECPDGGPFTSNTGDQYCYEQVETNPSTKIVASDPPLSVEMYFGTLEEDTLLEDSEQVQLIEYTLYNFTCVALGGSPPARAEWTLNGFAEFGLTSTGETDAAEVYQASQILIWATEDEHHGMNLTCTAINSAGELSMSVNLDILCKYVLFKALDSISHFEYLMAGVENDNDTYFTFLRSSKQKCDSYNWCY